MKRLLFAFAWFFLTSGIVLTASATAQTLWYSSDQELVSPLQASERVPVVVEPQQPIAQVQGVQTQYTVADGRGELVARFLERYDSPLKPYDYFGDYFVELADRYGFDFRLLPAIAMQESNLCKKIPEGSYNCLGFGIHERGTLTFPSFEANFERAARELKQNYIDEGRVTPEQIMAKYTPSSNGSWAASVTQWMTEMKYDDREKGKTLKKQENVLQYVVEPQASTQPNFFELETPIE